MIEPPTWTEVLTIIMTIQTGIMIGRTPKIEGKHRRKKKYRKGKRMK